MKTDPGSEAWALMLGLLFSTKQQRMAVAQEFELAPAQLQALWELEPGREVPMSALAESLTCDPSNVTGIVDRLEARGLIERRSSERDRRVKMLAVTPEGATVREQVMRRMFRPPEQIASLSKPDQRALRDVMRRTLAGEREPVSA
jgi:MarR family transcriptional regulator, organic hydroperoxide resistance regulator